MTGISRAKEPPKLTAMPNGHQEGECTLQQAGELPISHVKTQAVVVGLMAQAVVVGLLAQAVVVGLLSKVFPLAWEGHLR